MEYVVKMMDRHLHAVHTFKKFVGENVASFSTSQKFCVYNNGEHKHAPVYFTVKLDYPLPKIKYRCSHSRCKSRMDSAPMYVEGMLTDETYKKMVFDYFASLSINSRLLSFPEQQQQDSKKQKMNADSE